MELLARAATLQDARPHTLEMSTPRNEDSQPDFAKFTPQMFAERFLTQLCEEPIGGDADWCFDMALKHKKNTGSAAKAFFRLCVRRLI